MGLNSGLHPLPTPTAATVSMLRYLRAFLRAEGFGRCHDPLDSMWHGSLDRDGARRQLDMLVNVAVNRRGGLWARYGQPYTEPEPRPCSGSGRRVGPPATRHSDGTAPFNHRGAPCRKYDSRYQTDLLRDKRALEGRARVYRLDVPDHNRRFAHLIADRED